METKKETRTAPGRRFLELTGGGGSLVPSRPDWNLWDRQKSHPAHPATVRLQAAAPGDRGEYEAGSGGVDNSDCTEGGLPA